MNPMKKVALLTGAALLLVSTTAVAQETKGGREFGDQGVIAIGAATSLDLSYTSTSPPMGPGSSTTHIGVEPEIQYFVIDSLSVGGIINFDWASTSPPNNQ